MVPSDTILPPSWVVGMVSWEMESKVRSALPDVPVPAKLQTCYLFPDRSEHTSYNGVNPSIWPVTLARLAPKRSLDKDSGGPH